MGVNVKEINFSGKSGSNGGRKIGGGSGEMERFDWMKKYKEIHGPLLFLTQGKKNTKGMINKKDGKKNPKMSEPEDQERAQTVE